MNRPILAGDSLEHFDRELKHHRAWLLAVLERLVAREPQAPDLPRAEALAEGGVPSCLLSRRLWPRPWARGSWHPRGKSHRTHPPSGLMNQLLRPLGSAASVGLLTGQIVVSIVFVGACQLPNGIQALLQANQFWQAEGYYCLTVLFLKNGFYRLYDCRFRARQP